MLHFIAIDLQLYKIFKNTRVSFFLEHNVLFIIFVQKFKEPEGAGEVTVNFSLARNYAASQKCFMSLKILLSLKVTQRR